MKSDRAARQAQLDAAIPGRRVATALQAGQLPTLVARPGEDASPLRDHQPMVQGGTPGPVTLRQSPAHDPDRMNRLEARYAVHLDAEVAAGRVRSWRFQAIALRLSKRTYSRPDFWVVVADGSVEIHEVKGKHVWEDSRLKAKLARDLWPEFGWRWVTEGEGGTWDLEVL